MKILLLFHVIIQITADVNVTNTKVYNGTIGGQILISAQETNTISSSNGSLP